MLWSDQKYLTFGKPASFAFQREHSKRPEDDFLPWARILANFEGLIRSALAKQNSVDQGAREKVYQSSRNALQRMIAANRNLTVENALTQQRALEDAILRIEAQITGVPLEPLASVTPPQAPSVSQQSFPQPEPVQPATLDMEQGAAPNVSVEPIAPEPVVTNEHFVYQTDDDIDANPDIPPEFSRRRRSQRKFFNFLGIAIVLAVLGWIGYLLVTGFADGNLFNFNSNNGVASNFDPGAQQLDDAEYILILEPGDASALDSAGRGSAEIVNQLNANMLRIVSLRDSNNRTQAAKAILLKIKPGVLEQIAGKSVTVEIYAKSGNSGPAAFSVECMFGNLGDCGRKRFRIGLQPEASVFSVNVPSGLGSSANASFAIRTDITSSAEISGEGDAVDIIYVRLRVRS